MVVVVVEIRNGFGPNPTHRSDRKTDTNAMLSYKKLDVYRCAIELLALIMEVLGSWKGGKGNAVLKDQLHCAGMSIPLNIAEGVGKMSKADQSKYFVIARGSAMEVGAAFDVALVLRLVDEATVRRAEELVTRIVGMLTKMCHLKE